LCGGFAILTLVPESMGRRMSTLIPKVSVGFHVRQTQQAPHNINKTDTLTLFLGYHSLSGSVKRFSRLLVSRTWCGNLVAPDVLSYNMQLYLCSAIFVRIQASPYGSAAGDM
jgi:hypothetical protein